MELLYEGLAIVIFSNVKCGYKRGWGVWAILITVFEQLYAVFCADKLQKKNKKAIINK